MCVLAWYYCCDYCRTAASAAVTVTKYRKETPQTFMRLAIIKAHQSLSRRVGMFQNPHDACKRASNRLTTRRQTDAAAPTNCPLRPAEGCLLCVVCMRLSPKPRSLWPMEREKGHTRAVVVHSKQASVSTDTCFFCFVCVCPFVFTCSDNTHARSSSVGIHQPTGIERCLSTLTRREQYIYMPQQQ